MFSKDKRDGTRHGAVLMDGHKENIRQREVSSPTVSLKSMVLSCAIDANKGRYAVVTDIPGLFLHVDMEDEVHMLLEGTIAPS